MIVLCGSNVEYTIYIETFRKAIRHQIAFMDKRCQNGNAQILSCLVLTADANIRVSLGEQEMSLAPRFHRQIIQNLLK